MSTGDWQPVAQQHASNNDDWGAASAHASSGSDDWGAQTVDGMAQTWAKHYKVEPVPDVANPQVGAMIDRAAGKYGVSAREARIIAGIESAGGRVTSTSSAGAQGIFQLLPSTFRSLGGKDINDPEQNIDAGVRYYASLRKRFGDPYKAAMAYNMGPNGLQSALAKGFNDIPDETRQYAAKLYVSLQQPVQQVASANAPETKAATHSGVHPQIQEAGVGDAALATVRGAIGQHGVFDNTVRWLKNQQHEAAQDPLGAVDAVTGGLQRYVEGNITQAHHDKFPNPFADFAHGIDVMVHPRNQQMQERELNDLVDILHLPHAQGKDLASRVTNFASHFSAQSATDPLNLPWLRALRTVKGAAGIVKTLDSVVDAAKSVGARIPGVQQAANAGRAMTRTAFVQGVRQLERFGNEVFGRRPELDKFLDAQGKGARLSIEQKHRTMEAAQAASDDALLKAHEDELRKLKPGQPLPEPIRQRYLQEPWRYGTPEMRTEAERLGYKPTAEDLAKFAKPKGVLHYNLREDYQTMIRPPKGKTWEDMPIFREVGGQHREEFAGFEKARRAEGALPEDQYELTKNRLGLGRARVRQVATDQETADYLNQYGGWHGKGPVDVAQLSHTPKRFAPDSPLRVTTRIQKTAIAFNPLPHGLKNVGTLAYLKGGPEAFGRGLGYASKGLEKSQIERLMNMGLDAEYVRDIEGPLKKLAEKAPQVQGAYHASNKVLTRLELGYRQALLDQLDREMGPSELPSGAIDLAKEYHKADIIRQALGDYRNNSAFVAALDAIGGPFVAFRMGIVPGAVGRTLVKRPDRIEQIARGQKDFNDTVMQGSPSEFEMGGPVEDAARMAADPWGYLTSPSSIGPIFGEAHRWLDPNKTLTGGQIRDEFGRTFIPGYQLGEELGIPQKVFGGGYGPPPGVHPAAADLAAALGAYFQRRPSARANQRFKRSERRAQ